MRRPRCIYYGRRCWAIVNGPPIYGTENSTATVSYHITSTRKWKTNFAILLAGVLRNITLIGHSASHHFHCSSLWAIDSGEVGIGHNGGIRRKFSEILTRPPLLFFSENSVRALHQVSIIFMRFIYENAWHIRYLTIDFFDISFWWSGVVIWKKYVLKAGKRPHIMELLNVRASQSTANGFFYFY